MTTLDQNQQDELTHLVRLAQTHPSWLEYAMWKAQARAAKYPAEWGWLPAALSKELESSAKDESATSNMRPDEPPQTG